MRRNRVQWPCTQNVRWYPLGENVTCVLEQDTSPYHFQEHMAIFEAMLDVMLDYPRSIEMVEIKGCIYLPGGWGTGIVLSRQSRVTMLHAFG